ncbi:hypothetical protein B0H14DRAFT_2590046 [Mycena olivaceomarginata]|nr:hypothetical protein B0H14DRAFT_2590046 [Mycena olivaceomarginata]
MAIGLPVDGGSHLVAYDLHSLLFVMALFFWSHPTLLSDIPFPQLVPAKSRTWPPDVLRWANRPAGCPLAELGFVKRGFFSKPQILPDIFQDTLGEEGLWTADPKYLHLFWALYSALWMAVPEKSEWIDRSNVTPADVEQALANHRQNIIFLASLSHAVLPALCGLFPTLTPPPPPTSPQDYRRPRWAGNCRILEKKSTSNGVVMGGSAEEQPNVSLLLVGSGSVPVQLFVQQERMISVFTRRVILADKQSPLQAAQLGYFTSTFTNNASGSDPFHLPDYGTKQVVIDLGNNLGRSFEGGSISASLDGRVKLGGTFLQLSELRPSNYTFGFSAGMSINSLVLDLHLLSLSWPAKDIASAPSDFKSSTPEL